MPIVDLVGHEPTIPFGRRILSALRMLSATDRNYNFLVHLRELNRGA